MTKRRRTEIERIEARVRAVMPDESSIDLDAQARNIALVVARARRRKGDKSPEGGLVPVRDLVAEQMEAARARLRKNRESKPH